MSPSLITSKPIDRARPLPVGIAKSGITYTGLTVGTLFVPITCFIVAWAEIKLMTLQVGYLQMPPAVIALFLLLIAVNGLSRLLTKKAALTAQDLLLVYSMMTVAAMISSRGMMQKLLPLLVTANYFADDANDWRSLYFPYLKSWLMAFDPSGGAKQPSAVRFFEGLRIGESIPWNLWILPTVLWSILVLLVFGAFLFMASILRRQWVENEKLSFPLVQLPLELVGKGDARDVPLLQNRLTWIGFAIPFLIFLMKGLHTWYPSVPDIPLEGNIGDYLTTPPWNGIYYTPVKMSFAIIGFMFLLPSDLVFSLWFFFVLSRVQDILCRAANIDMPGMPMYPSPLYRGYQAIGAYLVLTVYLLRVAMPHLRKVWAGVIAGKNQSDDAGELFSYRTAFAGFWVCAIGAGLFLMLIGMSPLLAMMQLGGLFFVIAFIMARSTAEAGMLMTETSFRPVDLLRLVTPLHALGPQNLTALALSDSLLMRDQRSLLLGGFLDGLRIADGAAINRRPFMGIVVGALLLSVVCAAGIQIWLPYKYGGLQLYGYVYQGNNRMGFEDYQQYIRSAAVPMSWQGPVFLLVGIVVTVLLVWGRATQAAFPLHPLGYALCSSWTMIVFWFPAFVSWALKALILRYGGMKLYRMARPFFLGMILGEFAAALVWTLVNAISDTPVPGFPWA